MIAICPNPFRDAELALTKELDAMLRAAVPILEKVDAALNAARQPLEA